MTRWRNLIKSTFTVAKKPPQADLALAEVAVAVINKSHQAQSLEKDTQAGVKRLPEFGAALLSAAMALPCTMALAESAPEKGTLSFKYLNYKERQQVVEGLEGASNIDTKSGASAFNDRIRVKATATNVVLPLNSAWSFSGTQITDSISGASPAYHTLALTGMHDFRRALDAALTHYSPHGTLTVGLSHSGEYDYVSRGVSMLGTHATEDKNTTWSAGIGVNRDQINPSNQIVSNETKKGADLILGVTQVVSMNDIVQLNLGYYTGKGYYSDPYKVYDERPRNRQHETAQVRWNHYFNDLNATSRVAYRYYSDNWGVRSHTIDGEWVQRLMANWSVTPSIRYYTQNAAKFYVPADPSSYPFAPNPPENAIYYSEDQRLSAFGGLTMGMKVSHQLNLDTKIDIKLEQYGQKGSWKLLGSGSQHLAPFYFRSLQIGITNSF